MDTPYIPQRTVPEDVRRTLARELSRYYFELSDADDKPPPRFSLARALEQAATDRGLTDGYEKELCSSTAMIAGEHYDPHRLLIPLQALKRDMTAASVSGSGYLVETKVASPLDTLRPWSVVAEAGITVMPGLVGNVTIPKVTAASAGGWLADEATQASATQPTVASVAMTPKHAAAVTSFSRQWRTQAEYGEPLVVQQLLAAAGKLLDVAFFNGSGGSGQPAGLLITPNVGTQSGSSLAHAGLIAMRASIIAAGGREANIRWVGTGAVQALLAARERASGGGKMLWDAGQILDRPAYATANAPASTLVAGDFSTAVMGWWGPSALRVEVDPYSAFRTGVITARIIVSVDFAFTSPAAFVVASSVT